MRTVLVSVVFVLLLSAIPCFAIEMQQAELVVADGRAINVGIAKPEGVGPFPVVILQRGNGGSLEQYKKALPRYARNGFLAVAIDLSVGRDEVDYASNRIKLVIEAIKARQDVRPDKIGLWGLSNGGAAALTFIEKNKVQALVLYGPAVQRAPEAETIVGIPVLFLHGSQDSVISDDAAKRYYEKVALVNKQVSFKLLDGKGHSWDSDVMTESIAFFKEYLK
ncbi:MAG: dienelactone hydrolase family protein [Geobacter sp.]|nr:dienelactone hydrolase family protein [Geobacter sp.]